MDSEEIKRTVTVPEVLRRYGVKMRSGRCYGICHDSKSYSAAYRNDLYTCFVCNKSLDVFGVVQELEGCDFSAAFKILGGTTERHDPAEVKKTIKRREINTKLRAVKEEAENKKTRALLEKRRQLATVVEAFEMKDGISDSWKDEPFWNNSEKYGKALWELQKLDAELEERVIHV